MLNFLVRLYPLLTMCAIATGCDRGSKAWLDLPSNGTTTYKVSLQTFEDPDSISQPFRLGIRSMTGDGSITQLFSAEQCNNVEVFQGTNDLTIFYDFLVLDHFSGDDHGENVPRALLCDNDAPSCRELRSNYAKRGIQGVPVCTAR